MFLRNMCERRAKMWGVCELLQQWEQHNSVVGWRLVVVV